MDKGHQLTNKELERIEKNVAREYAQAEKEMRKKLKTFEKEFDAKTKEKRKLLQDGKITKADYTRWYNNKIAQSKWMQDMIDTYSAHQVAANQRAADIINKGIRTVYAENYNYGTYEVEKAIKMDTAFTLINENSIRNLAMKASVNVPKDSAWHDRKIRSAITQGILQGEEASKVANRVATVSGMDERAAMRTARTMVTGAQNSGRLDSYHRAAEMGIKLKKTWIATLDDRTRASHAWLDGETIPLDEAFSNGLMYPADPDGDPEETYNCRCRMIRQLEGFERDPSDLGLRPAQIGSYEEWKNSHPKYEVIDGKWQKVPSGTEIKVPMATPPKVAPISFDSAKIEQSLGAEYAEFQKTINSTGEMSAVFSKYADNCREYRLMANAGQYKPSIDTVFYSLDKMDGIHKYSTLAHEMSHMIDRKIGKMDGLSFKEIDLINSRCKIGSGAIKVIKEAPSQSDEFLTAVRKDMAAFNKRLSRSNVDAFKEEMLKDTFTKNATSGVQDALDGFYDTQKNKIFPWGHGNVYYNRNYNRRFKDFGLEKELKQALNELGHDASNQNKVKKLTRHYETASEAWANVGSAIACGGAELEAFEKYMPETVKTFRTIIGRVK